MEPIFNTQRKLGFGTLRLPMKGDQVDTETFSRMVDAFLAQGFTYFDTAHGYLGGKSEEALRECLTSRYPRERYVLADKLTNSYFQCREDIRPVFERQLKACGVSYFDVYLMHSQSQGIYAHFKNCRAYEEALRLKEEGKIRHFGISFHDRAELLEQILREYPQVELVQIQLNYLDFEDPAVQSRKCYEVCRRFGKAVIVMEPVKGGHLANLPPDAGRILEGLSGGSPASYAIRFAAGFAGVAMVLSGMSTPEQVADNLGVMTDFQPLSPREREALDQVIRVFRGKHMIPCTACRYCVEGCPQGISIPDLFACMNAKKIFHQGIADFYYSDVHTRHGGKASQCVRCGACEEICPQHLPIRQLLEQVAAEFEGNAETGE